MRQITLTTLTAAGTATTPGVVSGELLAVHVTKPGAAGTVTIQTAHSPQTTLLTLTAAGTGWFYPRVPICDGTAGTLQYADGYRVYDTIPVCDHVEGVLNAAGTLAVTLMVR
jgi:hypothetical protein